MANTDNLQVKGLHVINPLSLVFGLLRKERSRGRHGSPEGRNPPDDTSNVTKTTMYNEEDISYSKVTASFLKDVVCDMTQSIADYGGYTTEQCIYIIDDPRLTDESTLILTLELSGGEFELTYEYDNRAGVKDFPPFDSTDFCVVLYNAEREMERSERSAREIADTERWLNITER